jgi:hypothetical protein
MGAVVMAVVAVVVVVVVVVVCGREGGRGKEMEQGSGGRCNAHPRRSFLLLDGRRRRRRRLPMDVPTACERTYTAERRSVT